MARGRRTRNRRESGTAGARSRSEREKQALQSLAKKREAFEPILRRIIDAVLHAYGPRREAEEQPPSGTGREVEESWIEVGSGLGQLRALLADQILDRITHTELSPSLAKSFAERHPQARVLAADATSLPFESGSADVVMGLCVFDSLSEPAQATREFRRVLRKGGRFVHFLDAATNVEPILVELVAAGRLPLPNFVADTAMLEPALFHAPHFAHLLGPYHDVLSVPLQQFDAVATMLSRAKHPMEQLLRRYASPFLARPFDSLAAARAFVALTSDVPSGRPVNQALTSLISTLSQPPYRQHIPFDVVPHSSLAHFQTRLEGFMGPRYGFHPRLSSVICDRDFEANTKSFLRAHVRRVGIVRNSVDWPDPEGIPIQRLTPDSVGHDPGGVSPSTHILREAAIYCFVAEKA